MSEKAPPLAAELFELDPEILWIQHCAEGPMPKAAADAVRAFLPRETQPWRLRWVADFQGIPQRLRALGGRLLGTAAENVSLTATTSSGLSTVAQAYPWEAGDEVLLPLGEFPSNYWPWQALERRGVKVRQAPLWPGQKAGSDAWISAPPDAAAAPEDALLGAIGPATRVLSVSWVRFQDGLALDLAKLARGCAQRGVDLVVDGIQGAGTLPVDLEGVAAFATGGHKGLLAPQGLGFLMTAPEFRKRLLPLGSWLSVEDATDFRRPSTDFERDFLPDGSVFEQGVPDLLSGVALEAALEVVLGAGVEKIAAHVAALRAELIERLAGLPAWNEDAERLRRLDGAGRLGSIVALHHGGRGQQALDAINRRGVGQGIYASVREGYLRLALHGWHTSADLERIVAWLVS
jgi:cysteine desulfurase / selenocysteine lyase